MTYKQCKKACEKKGLRMPCITGPPQEPNDDPNFGGEDCTIKWNDGTVWNDVPCDFTYPCYCQAVKGGGY